VGGRGEGRKKEEQARGVSEILCCLPTEPTAVSGVGGQQTEKLHAEMCTAISWKVRQGT
jgi:hypothetical protein